MPSSPESRILATLVKHAQNSEIDPLTPLIESYYLKREKPEFQHLRLHKYEIDTTPRPRPHGRLSPSSAGGCEREAVLKFLGVKGQKRIDPEMQMIFEDGHWRHHKWGFIFLEMERFFPNRFKVVSIEEDVTIGPLFIAGSLDAVVKIKVGGKWRRYVIDFKGANEYAWNDAYRTKRPNPKYVLQLITYMRAKKCKRGILLYESKDKNKPYVFHVAFTDEKWAEVRQWARRVIKALDEKKLPEKHPECVNGTFLYNRCPYRGMCFGNQTPKQIGLKVFKGFGSSDELWEEGHVIIRSHNERVGA